MSTFLCAPCSWDSAGKTKEKSLLLQSSWNLDLRNEPNNKLKSQMRIYYVVIGTKVKDKAGKGHKNVGKEGHKF
jgi:hypothetical protein